MWIDYVHSHSEHPIIAFWAATSLHDHDYTHSIPVHPLPTLHSQSTLREGRAGRGPHQNARVGSHIILQ